MVFKRRQKATARTERGGGGESRGYCEQWARQLHSSDKTSRKNRNCESSGEETLKQAQLVALFRWEKGTVRDDI